ncbi:hypothetical protein Hbl1158_05505 [Halobaculum sp. CBA1158]|uniref:hypothetical protein n=1 Tax=Halobaculum sp. CBA1158 TaxID=2904243 RepID=UPI001F266EEE|nr:hypothetical protein [Halobaculum sp. CBA1158]UIP00813.1 hypothetical protein Hbl1158_05505 [Halobaculum sp. CBA1158]
MAAVEAWTLWLHVAAGAVAVFAGVGALVTAKGGTRHRTAGTVFLLAMGVVVATVFVLLAFDPTTLRIVLTLVAVFSGYLAFSGYRALSRKRPSDRTHSIDWIATGSVVLACLVLGVWGLGWYLDGRSFGIVMAVFGAIGIAFGAIDIRAFRSDGTDEWMVSHLQRMIAAFIATVSAVSAVNLTPLIGVSAWLWPTLLGVPLIAYWSNEYSLE